MKIQCITKYPFISVSGYGDFKRHDVFDFPDNVAKGLLKTPDWRNFKENPAEANKKRTDQNIKEK